MEDQIAKVTAAPYRREIVPNADGTWFARIAEFPGCITEGASAEDALVNLKDAMREWVRVQLEDGQAIPAPSATAPYSGKFMVRLSTRLHREVSECAASEGTSLNAFVASALARAVGDRLHILHRSVQNISNLRNAGISFMLDSTVIHATVGSAVDGFSSATSLRKTSSADYEQSRTAQFIASCNHGQTINLTGGLQSSSGPHEIPRPHSL